MSSHISGILKSFYSDILFLRVLRFEFAEALSIMSGGGNSAMFLQWMFHLPLKKVDMFLLENFCWTFRNLHCMTSRGQRNCLWSSYDRTYDFLFLFINSFPLFKRFSHLLQQKVQLLDGWFNTVNNVFCHYLNARTWGISCTSNLN